MWDSAVATSEDGGCGDGRVGARGLRPEGGQYNIRNAFRECCSIKCQQYEKCSSNELLR